MSSPFEPRSRPSRRIGGYRGRKGVLGVPGRSLTELASAPPIALSSELDGLDGRYLGPVKARSSSRGCGQLKVLDCAPVWMMVRRASPRSPAPCAMTRGIACSRIAPPSSTLALGSNAKRVVAEKGQERSQSFGHRRQRGRRKVVSAPLARRRVVIGPSQGSANARRGTWDAPSCSLVSTNDRSERASAGSLPRPLGEIQRSESNLDRCLEVALLGRTERRVIRGFPAFASWISSRGKVRAMPGSRMDRLPFGQSLGVARWARGSAHRPPPPRTQATRSGVGASVTRALSSRLEGA